MPSKRGDRLTSLDGLRGVAVILVMIYHFGYRWAAPAHSDTLYPYGNIFHFIPGISLFGEFGVTLFFVVSGFVIMMTLERCTGILDFVGRRGARLWPSMLVCATLSTIIIQASGFYERYESIAYWEITAYEYALSIIFLDPGILASAVGEPGARWVEAVYWTLWQEVLFYVLIAITYWASPRSAFLWVWVGLQAASLAYYVGRALSGDPLWGGFWVGEILQPEFLAFFTLGIFFWRAYCHTLNLALGVAAMIALVGVALRADIELRLIDGFIGLSIGPDFGAHMFMFGLIGCPFLCLIWRPNLLDVLAHPWLVLIGLASYPLYLCHERIGVIGLNLLSEAGVPELLALLIMVGGLVGNAVLIHRLVETPAKRMILRRWIPLITRLEARQPWMRFG